MALHSVSSVPHVLRLSEPFPSLHNAHLLLDLVPLRRKPKRRTRKLRAFPSPSPLPRSAVKAVLHIDRTTDNRLHASSASSSSDSKPQVCFCFLVAFFWLLSCVLLFPEEMRSCDRKIERWRKTLSDLFYSQSCHRNTQHCRKSRERLNLLESKSKLNEEEL